MTMHNDPRTLCLLLLLLTPPCALADVEGREPRRATGPFLEDGPSLPPIRIPQFDGFIDAGSLPATPLPALPGAQARTLSASSDGRRAAYELELPSGFRHVGRAGDFEGSLELIVLDGTLGVGEATLKRLDFAYVPPGGELSTLAALDGARVLMFLDPPHADPAIVRAQRARGRYVTHFADKNWKQATVARDAGRALALWVQDLKNDPDSTARTWYVKGGPDLSVPWERHSVVEEGYLVEGDYRLAECLPQGLVVGDYGPRGYFRRGPHIVHSGPESGTRGGVVWLMRSTPTKLDVVFADGCPAQ